MLQGAQVSTADLALGLIVVPVAVVQAEDVLRAVDIRDALRQLHLHSQPFVLVHMGHLKAWSTWSGPEIKTVCQVSRQAYLAVAEQAEACFDEV